MKATFSVPYEKQWQDENGGSYSVVLRVWKSAKAQDSILEAEWNINVEAMKEVPALTAAVNHRLVQLGSSIPVSQAVIIEWVRYEVSPHTGGHRLKEISTLEGDGVERAASTAAYFERSIIYKEERIGRAITRLISRVTNGKEDEIMSVLITQAPKEDEDLLSAIYQVWFDRRFPTDDEE